MNRRDLNRPGVWTETVSARTQTDGAFGASNKPSTADFWGRHGTDAAHWAASE